MSSLEDILSSLQQGVQAINALNTTLSEGNNFFPAVPQLPAYTVATVPSAAAYPYGQIYVTNESGGAQPAASDGTNWRRYSDRAIIS